MHSLDEAVVEHELLHALGHVGQLVHGAGRQRQHLAHLKGKSGSYENRERGAHASNL